MVHGYTSLTTLSLSPLSSSDATHFYIAITMHISTPVQHSSSSLVCPLELMAAGHPLLKLLLPQLLSLSQKER
jgi:hypothetical protein